MVKSKIKIDDCVKLKIQIDEHKKATKEEIKRAEKMLKNAKSWIPYVKKLEKKYKAKCK